MPESMNSTGQATSPEVLPLTASEDRISPQRRDEIYASITDAEWAKFRNFSHVAIGRLNREEQFRVLGGFDQSGEGLVDLALAFPNTASYFVAWHRDFVRAAPENNVA